MKYKISKNIANIGCDDIVEIFVSDDDIITIKKINTQSVTEVK